MWEAWLFGFPTGLLGLAHRKKTEPQNLSKNPTRRRILEFLEEQPAVNLRGLQEGLDCNRGTLSHHLRLLEAAGLIASVSQGREHHYFPKSEPIELRRQLAVLRQWRTLEMVLAVRDEPGIPQKELRRRLGTSRKVLRERLDLLEETGLLEEVPQERTRLYYPTPLLTAALRKLKVPTAAPGTQAEVSDTSTGEDSSRNV